MSTLLEERYIFLIMSRQWRTQEFCSGGGGVQQIQSKTERTGILGAVAP